MDYYAQQYVDDAVRRVDADMRYEVEMLRREVEQLRRELNDEVRARREADTVLDSALLSIQT